MKKYLFLLFLFILYIILITYHESKPVISYDNVHDYGVSSYNIIFEDGINSNKLIELFNNYDDEYLVTSIILSDKNNYKLSCNFIKTCISNINEQETEEFKINHINGFNISNITLISNSNKITNFLNSNDIYYKEERETY